MNSIHWKPKLKRLKRTTSAVGDEIIPETPPSTPPRNPFIDDEALGSADDLSETGYLSGEPAGPIILSKGPAVEAKSSKFRFCASRVFLTYSKCDLERDKVSAFLKEKCKATRWIIASEKHKDGTPHIHAFAFLEKELDTRNERFFDIEGFHPNIKNAEFKKDWKRAVYYCMKAGDYEVEDLDLFDSPEGFCRKWQDMQAWKQHIHLRKDTEVKWPLRLPDEKRTMVNKPKASDRVRHWWLVSKPNWGKSYWATIAFANTNVYYPINNSDCPFDHYSGQQVIVFDDFLWKEEHRGMLIDVGNVVHNQKHVWGRTRHHPKFWPRGGELGGVRLIVVLDNRIPFQWMDQEWFTSRFNVLDLDSHPKFDPTL